MIMKSSLSALADIIPSKRRATSDSLIEGCGSKNELQVRMAAKRCPSLYCPEVVVLTSSLKV